jgi:ABC-type bacteriocin/lantibiotic exporter with double-glycine peptidase domain
MGRKNLKPVKQPNDVTCGPASNKMALEILGVRKSLKTLIDLCKTNSNGTSLKNMINALTSLGYPVLEMHNTNLSHLQRALKHSPNHMRAVLVTYLSERDDTGKLKPDSGHWSVVSSYLPSKSRIVLVNSYTAKKKSFNWQDFRSRWKDYDYTTRKSGKTTKRVRKWNHQLMLVVAKTARDLPKFTLETQTLHIPGQL